VAELVGGGASRLVRGGGAHGWPGRRRRGTEEVVGQMGRCSEIQLQAGGGSSDGHRESIYINK
jgi:hypothetical protein